MQTNLLILDAPPTALGPPVRLCGSPALDAALLEIVDYERAVSLVMEKKRVDRDPVPDARDRGAEYMKRVVDALRKHKRDIKVRAFLFIGFIKRTLFSVI